MKIVKIIAFAMALWMSLMSVLCCDEGEYRHTESMSFFIENNLDEDIYVVDWMDEKPTMSSELVFVKYPYLDQVLAKIPAGQTGRVPGGVVMGEDAYGKLYQIIVFNVSTLEKYTRDELADGNINDGVFIMTLDEVVKNKRILSYPTD